jgi:dTDP-4-dehydrorhamnose 3,5-epimerase
MRVLPTKLEGLVIIEPDVFGDDRGYFLESWSQRRFAEAGIDQPFVQDNLSRSSRGTLRGLHLQSPPHGQGKLVHVLEGEVFDVAVDVRVDSPTFGQWIGATLSAQNHRQVYVPPGFAHGFCVTSEYALFAYKCTQGYAPASELCVLWNDPALGIEWPVREPLLSKKDALGVPLAAAPRDRLPRMESA